MSMIRKGAPEDNIPPGTVWKMCQEDWVCPDCGAMKNDFEMIQSNYMAIYKGKTYTIEYEYHPGLKQEAIVLFHPHPLYLGTMMNKVITTCSIAARQLEYSFLRFNYTGVGDSSGFFGFGEYEATQAMALMGGVLQEPVKYHIGFSFGCNKSFNIYGRCKTRQQMLFGLVPQSMNCCLQTHN